MESELLAPGKFDCLLQAGNPVLVLGEQPMWRVDVALISPTQGQMGLFGRIEIEAITGQMATNEAAEKFTPRAPVLTAHCASATA